MFQVLSAGFAADADIWSGGWSPAFVFGAERSPFSRALWKSIGQTWLDGRHRKGDKAGFYASDAIGGVAANGCVWLDGRNWRGRVTKRVFTQVVL